MLPSWAEFLFKSCCSTALRRFTSSYSSSMFSLRSSFRQAMRSSTSSGSTALYGSPGSMGAEQDGLE